MTARNPRPGYALFSVPPMAAALDSKLSTVASGEQYKPVKVGVIPSRTLQKAPPA